MIDPIRNSPRPGFGEFVALMAMLTSLVALSIDAVLPALPSIGEDLGVVRENDNQLVVALLFLGFAFGQMVYGPLSDSTGRKRAAYLGLGLFMLGAVLSMLAWSFPVVLLGRFLQGFGVAGPRTITIAMVRDQFAGREMARVMSFIMGIFILGPVVAPSIGQLALSVAGWRAIFGGYLVMALVTTVWFALRQRETLDPSRRLPLAAGRLAGAVREVFRSRLALGYTVAAGLVFGSFLGYLNSAQQILQVQYGLGRDFPLYFAGLALAIGGASFSNARLVMRFGMRRLVGRALVSIWLVSSLFLAIAWQVEGHPPLVALMGYLTLVFFGVGILFGNLNALAMEPLGHIAGTGAAVVGSFSTLISLVLGTLIGQSYDRTVIPLVGGFALLSAAAALVVRWTERPSRGESERSSLLELGSESR
jgi:DHA1 family bicyclomycin/chloramphenicol resistance-like MFS transporter